ncbi:DUF6686 family protein [Flavivirga abyssicola]|uniref:DUF6686 family protein n=1 Tax=Flavivirga abyssicola TaxID=3063533 RepID=UPI0026DECBA1|nr:DUF6686 family protein [Flavivirga sp. MEBiC07777]WVK15061.1 DUF6686 family protein [Flavivirga sp. MEBiC07777]
MCNSIRTIAKVTNGELSICEQCNVYHVEFNNIYFEFTPNEFDHFKDYLLNIELDYWEERYSCAKVKRKIPIPSMQKNLVLMFNRQEIKELKLLFCGEECSFENVLHANDIDYKLILN